MTAFRDESIKGIIANIGGEDSIRLFPYIDFDVLRENPKIFMGYSDVTVSHLFCHKAGISSFYGPAILTDFAENVEMVPYTFEMVKRSLFSNEIISEPRSRYRAVIRTVKREIVANCPWRDFSDNSKVLEFVFLIVS